MNSTAQLLAARFPQKSPLHPPKYKNNASIEIVVGKAKLSTVEIPAEVDALIDNKAYRPKFKKLLREYRREIMALVEVAHTKTQPSRWFAKATAKANWERTTKFLAKLFKIQETAERVASKIGLKEVSKFIYKQIWGGVNVERWADTAAETGKHKAKYFTWLCRREQGATNAAA